MFDKISKFMNIFIDFIVNNKKYYKYNIFALLTLLLIFIYFIINYFNIFNIKNTKYSQIIILLSISVFVSIFYFFIYRNEFSHINNNESKYFNRKNLLDGDVFHKDNFKDTIKNPIIKLLQSLFGTILLISIPVMLIVGFFWLFNYQQMYNITQLIIGFTLLITTLSIVAYLFKINTSNCEKSDTTLLNDIGCLIKNIIFFLPCLLVAIVEYINRDLNLTPYSIYLLLIIEIIIVCVYFLLPTIFKSIASLNNNDLLSGEGAFYLDNKKILGTYQQLTKEKDYFKSENYKKFTLFQEDSDKLYNVKAEIDGPEKQLKSQYKYTYSISFYLYLNPQANNTNISYNEETELFNYGYKPVIYYNGKNQTLSIKSKTLTSEGDSLDTIYKTRDIKYQKWIYFVINYDNNNIDVFMDGKLVGAKNNVPPYFKGDKVSIGENNGIQGSIKDIYYFDKVKPEDNIEFLYNLSQK